MTASPFDSAVWRGLLFDAELSPLFSDTATLRAELLVLGSLAQTQAGLGRVPEVSAKAIQRAAMEVQVDPAGLARMTAETGDPLMALVAAFQHEMKAPEHSRWVHLDSDPALTEATGLALRLRQCLRLLGPRLGGGGGAAPDLGWLCAYHPDPDTRAGLAAGLDLRDSAGRVPAEAIRAIADWAATRGGEATAPTGALQALRHSLAHFNAIIQTADASAFRACARFALPQLMLGLACLTRPQAKR